MKNQFNLYCFDKLAEVALNFNSDTYEADEVTCAYVDYLTFKGHGDLLNHLIAKRVMASTAQLIPTKVNQIQGEIL